MWGHAWERGRWSGHQEGAADPRHLPTYPILPSAKLVTVTQVLLS